MIFINHRINTREQLNYVPLQNGIEVDVRYHKNDLILHHEPFYHHIHKPEKFEDLLKEWNHKGPIILNIKTEGIEEACIELMNKYSIKNWFFLDISMPYFVKYAQISSSKKINGFSEYNLAVRYSEREPIEYTLAFANKAKWVWVDCFTKLPLNKSIYENLKGLGFQICLVSPELQKHSLARIAEFLKQCEGLDIEAVCTKRPDLWGQKLPSQTIKKLKVDYPV